MTIVLGTRHLVLALVSAVLLFAALGGFGLVLARSVLPGLMARKEVAPQEQVLVVDAPRPVAAVEGTKIVRAPVAKSSNRTAPSAAQSQTPPTPKPAAAPAEPAEPPVVSEPTPVQFGDPQPGQLFLQVLSTNRTMAVVNAERITSSGLPCLVAQGTDERNYRVLVGPIEVKDQVTEMQARLEEMGFRPFPRRYKRAL